METRYTALARRAYQSDSPVVVQRSSASAPGDQLTARAFAGVDSSNGVASSDATSMSRISFAPLDPRPIAASRAPSPDQLGETTPNTPSGKGRTRTSPEV